MQNADITVDLKCDYLSNSGQKQDAYYLAFIMQIVLNVKALLLCSRKAV